jgi:hypothetical protein
VDPYRTRKTAASSRPRKGRPAASVNGGTERVNSAVRPHPPRAWRIRRPTADRRKRVKRINSASVIRPARAPPRRRVRGPSDRRTGSPRASHGYGLRARPRVGDDRDDCAAAGREEAGRSCAAAWAKGRAGSLRPRTWCHRVARVGGVGAWAKGKAERGVGGGTHHAHGGVCSAAASACAFSVLLKVVMLSCVY